MQSKGMLMYYSSCMSSTELWKSSSGRDIDENKLQNPATRSWLGAFKKSLASTEYNSNDNSHVSGDELAISEYESSSYDYIKKETLNNNFVLSTFLNDQTSDDNEDSLINLLIKDNDGNYHLDEVAVDSLIQKGGVGELFSTFLKNLNLQIENLTDLSLYPEIKDINDNEILDLADLLAFEGINNQTMIGLANGVNEYGRKVKAILDQFLGDTDILTDLQKRIRKEMISYLGEDSLADDKGRKLLEKFLSASKGIDDAFFRAIAGNMVLSSIGRTIDDQDSRHEQEKKDEETMMEKQLRESISKAARRRKEILASANKNRKSKKNG